mmetsp:Transcript_55500/g.118029  ORF Transcript_55500/g.118029 Transcript_55500/m.118029 type:complete len:126 (+) Transcript_55500:258-635(+)
MPLNSVFNWVYKKLFFVYTCGNRHQRVEEITTRGATPWAKHLIHIGGGPDITKEDRLSPITQQASSSRRQQILLPRDALSIAAIFSPTKSFQSSLMCGKNESPRSPFPMPPLPTKFNPRHPIHSS